MAAVLQTGSVLGLVPSAPGAQEHMHNPAVVKSQKSPTGDWVPSFLTVSQNETLIALGERIIPGSSEALCNRLIDSVLSIEAEKSRTELLQSLAAFDHEADQLHQRRFEHLSPAQQNEILTIASRGGKLHAEFGVVKEWTADAYWSSSKGLHELGSTGRMAWESFPDCGGQQSAKLE